MKKLIITDIDGTILHKGTLSNETIETVKSLREAGHYYTLATGRHHLAIKKLAERLGVDIPVICGNGTQIINLHTLEVIQELTISEKNVAAIHDICNKHNIRYALYCTNFIMGAKETLEILMGELRESKSTIVSTPMEMMKQTQSVIKFLLIEPNSQKRKVVRNELSSLNNIHMAASGDTFLDVTVSDSHKGNAIQVLAKYLDVSLNDVVAFGDQENDLQMLLTAGTGVAMGNAIPFIKEKVKIHTDSVANDGFSKYIKKNIL